MALRPQGEANLTRTIVREGAIQAHYKYVKGKAAKSSPFVGPLCPIFELIPVPFFSFPCLLRFFIFVSQGSFICLLPREFEIKAACCTRSIQLPHTLMSAANHITIPLERICLASQNSVQNLPVGNENISIGSKCCA